MLKQDKLLIFSREQTALLAKLVTIGTYFCRCKLLLTLALGSMTTLQFARMSQD